MLNSSALQQAILNLSRLRSEIWSMRSWESARPKKRGDGAQTYRTARNRTSSESHEIEAGTRLRRSTDSVMVNAARNLLNAPPLRQREHRISPPEPPNRPTTPTARASYPEPQPHPHAQASQCRRPCRSIFCTCRWRWRPLRSRRRADRPRHGSLRAPGSRDRCPWTPWSPSGPDPRWPV